MQKASAYAPKVHIAIEPRHLSWADEDALRLFNDYSVNKVLADPERCRAPRRLRPLVESRLRYYRLHGSPVMYRSSYEPEVIARLANRIQNPVSPTRETWVIFDNTTLGHAIENALSLQAAVSN